MKVIICEVFEVEADSIDEAVSQTRLNSQRDSVVFGGDSLRTLPHPIHLAEVDTKFGLIAPAVAPEVEQFPADEAVVE
jgi:hypothetical protein